MVTACTHRDHYGAPLMSSKRRIYWHGRLEMFRKALTAENFRKQMFVLYLEMTCRRIVHCVEVLTLRQTAMQSQPPCRVLPK